MKLYFGPYENNRERDMDIVIDDYDTWNADVTIATIAGPLLEKLRQTKQGAPYIDDNDVPEHLRSYRAPPKENSWDVDDNHFERYDWVLREIVWAMNEIASGNPEEKNYFRHADDFEDKETFEEMMESVVIDKEGLHKYEQRIADALKLFGKYFRTFWD
jgi:hypothetical protein